MYWLRANLKMKNKLNSKFENKNRKERNIETIKKKNKTKKPRQKQKSVHERIVSHNML